MFAKHLLASLLAASLALQVSAHAAIAPALGVKGTPARSDVQRPSAQSPCGNVNVAQALGTSAAVTMSGTTFAATITNFNGGTDGSRQVTATIDAAGTGKSFVAATVTKNGDKSPATTGSQQLEVKVPANTKCAGGPNKDTCLVSFTTAGGFGNCVAVKQGGAAAAAAAVGNQAAAKKGKAGKQARAWGSRQARAYALDDLE
eukprot:PLAT7091.8.p2 GENE.PLAT7091.8~~PLAT7091.8.p2  ORF type:complete len:202 (-),score=8.91 PLAT7091.8:135-740(-)